MIVLCYFLGSNFTYICLVFKRVKSTLLVNNPKRLHIFRTVTIRTVTVCKINHMLRIQLLSTALCERFCIDMLRYKRGQYNMQHVQRSQFNKRVRISSDNIIKQTCSNMKSYKQRHHSKTSSVRRWRNAEMS